MTIFIISAGIAIVFSFLCSLMEAVLLSFNKVKVETDKNKGIKYAIIFDDFQKNINRPISAILILNTIAHTGGATVAGSAFDKTFGSEYIWVFSASFTIVILFGTEIFPKLIGVSFSNILARYIAVPLRFIIQILYPLIVVTELFNKLIIKRRESSVMYSLEDIQTIAKVAQIENIINKDQEAIIVKTSNLRIRQISEVMLPISKVVFFPETISVDEYFELAEKYLHTRYPVSKTKSPQDITGYLNFKEIALKKDYITSDNLNDFVRPILFVSHEYNIIKVLKELNSRRYHLAFVQNELGENIGMVTLEDIVEEIVGEIEDEFDVVQ